MLKTSDQIFLIKLWWKFGKNFQSPPTSHCLDDMNMFQAIHQHLNFPSKFLYFFLNPNKKKNSFFPTSFSFRFFSFQHFFPPNFLRTKRSISCQWMDINVEILCCYAIFIFLPPTWCGEDFSGDVYWITIWVLVECEMANVLML